MNKKVMFTILFSKLCVFLVIFLAYNLLPTFIPGHYLNFLYQKNSPITLKSAYETWDAQHFLYLSEHGYHAGHISNQFSPVLPFLIYIFHFIFRDSFISGMFVSNIASAAAFYLFYALVRRLYSEKIAYMSLLFLIAFPLSFFYSLIYTESIFLLLVVLYFSLLFQKKYFLLSFIGFLIPLTRPVGLLIMLPAYYFYFFEDRKLTLHSHLSDFLPSIRTTSFFSLLSPLAGILFYFCIMYLATGNPFELFYAERFSVTHTSLLYMIQPVILFLITFNPNLTLHGFNNSILDRLFFFLFLLSLRPMYKLVSKTFFLYALTTGIFFVLIGMYMSYMRHLIVVFPLFIMLAILCRQKKYSFLESPLLYIMALLQSLFLIMHALNYWVA